MKLLFVASLLAVSPVYAQAEALFGTGKPFVFTETELDRRFLKTRIHKALVDGPPNVPCAQLLAGLLTALAETAPAMHKRDENFYLDPQLAAALDLQMSLPRFPAKAFLAAMVRRVRIDGRMPQEWLTRAEALKAPLVDLAKLRALADGVQPIDSFYLTLPMLKERYEREVMQANTSAADVAPLEFRDTYYDRLVAWGGLTLIDIGTRKSDDDSPDAAVARVEFRPMAPESRDPLTLIENKKPAPAVKLDVRLAPNQYAKLSKIPKNSKVWVRGRLHDITRGFTQLELRDGHVFEDRDWRGVPLVPPGAVARCPIAVNDLTGVAVRQPGGFGQQP